MRNYWESTKRNGSIADAIADMRKSTTEDERIATLEWHRGRVYDTAECSDGECLWAHSMADEDNHEPIPACDDCRDEATAALRIFDRTLAAFYEY